MKRIEFLGLPLDAAGFDESLDRVNRAISNDEMILHVGVNVSKLVDAKKDIELREAIKASDIINIDGMGIVWGARFLGYPIPERVAGVDFFLGLLEMAQKKSYPVYFLGATEAVINKTVLNLQGMYPGLEVAGYHHGYFWGDEEVVVDDIEHSKAKMLFVAITSPQKEYFIDRWKGRFGVNLVMGVGGTFDVIAGKTKRAPLWMQKFGLEWLYRVAQEPGRLWWRYLRTNTVFGYWLVKEKVKKIIF